jgi:uncharacterized protein
MAAFLLIYFGVYGSMHAYLFWKARRALEFGWRGGLALAFLMLLQMLAPILIRLFERAGWEHAARLLAWVGYTWFAMVFLFLSYGLCIDVAHLVLGILGAGFHRDAARFFLPAAWAFGLPLAVSLIAMGYGLWEASAPRVERLVLHSSKMPPGTRLVIAQISDVHLGLLVRDRYLSKVVAILEREKPDLIVSTGDLVDGDMNSLDGLWEKLAVLHPRLGKYAVTGNHEYYAGLEQALGFTRRCGFTVLRGESALAGERLALAGVDDIQGRYFKQVAGLPEGELLAALPRDRFILLMKHRPLVDDGSEGAFDLQLSGHTHKGQIFPFNLLVALVNRYPSGLVALRGGGELYTSRGTGTWGPPMRVFSPPEVTIIELKM